MTKLNFLHALACHDERLEINRNMAAGPLYGELHSFLGRNDGITYRVRISGS